MRAASTDGLQPDAAGSIRPGAVPLFHAAWLFAAGVVCAHFVWLNASWLLVALAVVTLLTVVAAVSAQRVLWLPLAALWLLLGGWCARMEPQPAPDGQIAALSDGLLRTLDGTVINAGPLRVVHETVQDEHQESAKAQAPPTQTLDLQLSTIEFADDLRDEQQPAEARLRLTVRWPEGAAAPRTFACGEQLRVSARLLPTESYRDPGAWSRGDYLLEQGITATTSVAVERVERQGQAPGRFFRCGLISLQHAASARWLALPAAMRRLPAALRIDDEDAIMLAAMVAGDRSFLTHSLRVGFERTGSFHMLVVSGFHLAVVAGFVFWIARRLRASQVVATFATLAVSLAYALFTGFATPVQRSLWMVAVYLLGRLFYRERSPLNTIGFAALVLLVASPRSLFESSFQMTLLAVVAIGGVAAPLLEHTVHPYLVATRDLRTTEIDVKLAPPVAAYRVLLRLFADAQRDAVRGARAKRLAWAAVPWLARFAVRVVELVVVACVVELAMTLPMAVYFHRITLTALPVNLLILPLLSVLLPAALVTLALLTVWPAAALLPAAVTALFLHLGVGLVRFFGSVSWGDFRIASPLGWQTAAFCGLLGAAIVLARGQQRARRLACGLLVGAALAAVCPRAIEHPRDALLAEAIDVGQGDSMLLVTPDGKTLLVDGGGFTGGPRALTSEFDIGEEVVSPALWARGIRRLDVVALSHAHSDHMGGLTAVLRNFHPAELWVGENPPSEAYQNLLAEAHALGIAVRVLHAGDVPALGDVQVRVLAPRPGYRPGAAPANNDSLVLRVAFGEGSVQLEGDAEAKVEAELLNGPMPESTLLKVGHHGSTNATSPAFLARVHPRAAVISSGRNNRFGHPHLEVLKELQGAGVRTLRTDLYGAVCFEIDQQGAVRMPSCDR